MKLKYVILFLVVFFLSFFLIYYFYNPDYFLEQNNSNNLVIMEPIVSETYSNLSSFSECLSMDSSNSSDDCLIYFANKENERTICFNITDSWKKHDCLMLVEAT